MNIIQFDGMAIPNPGKMGIGVVLKMEDTIVEEISEKLPNNGTNNRAEYLAVLSGVKRALELGWKDAIIEGDSKLVINQLKGSWKVKNEDLKGLYSQVIEALMKFDTYILRWIPREENSIADKLAARAFGYEEDPYHQLKPNILAQKNGDDTNPEAVNIACPRPGCGMECRYEVRIFKDDTQHISKICPIHGHIKYVPRREPYVSLTEEKKVQRILTSIKSNNESHKPQKIRGLITIDGHSLFPISWLGTQAFCEYQLYLENWKGIIVKPTKSMKKGKLVHTQLKAEFDKEALPASIHGILNESRKEIINSREFFVQDIAHGIYGYIDDVIFSPNYFGIIDDKPKTEPYLTDKNQVYGYCLAFQSTIGKYDERPIIAVLRTRGTDDIYWSSPFDENITKKIIRVINHIHDLISGTVSFKSTKNSNKCRGCKMNFYCDKAIRL